MSGSLRVGKIAGINIDIDWSWLIILVLLTVSLATGWYPAIYHGWAAGAYWGAGLISAILLFASVLAHELAHSLMALARGVPVKNITLFIFGGVSNIEHEPTKASTDFLIAIVGPIASLIIGVITFILGASLLPTRPFLAAILSYLGVSNLLLGGFNLIPGFPLDGGRVLRAIIWGISGSLRTATRWASLIGELVAMLFILIGVLELFFLNSFLGGIWLVFTGWFLWHAARTANKQVAQQSPLKGVTAADVMNRAPVTVPGDITVRQFADDYVLTQGERAAMVVEDGQLAGLITLADLRQVPRDRWGQELVAQAMVPVQKLHTVTPGQSLNDVLPLMAHNDVSQVPVVANGQVVGVVTRDGLTRYVELQREMGASDQASPTPIPAMEVRELRPEDYDRPLAGAS